MLETQRRLQQALSDEDKKLLKQRAATLNKQIDNAVYKLYNLTADEVKIVEGARKIHSIQFWKQKDPFTLSSTIGDIGNL